MIKKRILFVTEKYNDKSGNNGLSNTFHNIFDTCSAYGRFECNHLFLDELYMRKLSIDSELVLALQHDTYDYIIFSYYGCDYNINPKYEYIEIIRAMCPNTKLVFLWWDAAHPCNQQQIMQLSKLATLQINFDGSILDIPNVVFFPVPQNQTMFCPRPKDIFASFVGRTDGYIERCKYLEFIQSKIPLNVAGGRTQQNLSADEYAAMIGRSEICLNFCNTLHGWPQCKGRVWEVLSCGSMLLEQHNSLTSQYLIDGVHYVSFVSPENVVNQLLLLEQNKDEMIKIAKAGYELYHDKYSPNRFWELIWHL